MCTHVATTTKGKTMEQRVSPSASIRMTNVQISAPPPNVMTEACCWPRACRRKHGSWSEDIAELLDVKLSKELHPLPSARYARHVI